MGKTVLDVAIEVMQVALILAGAAPALIAAFMIVPAVFWSLTGWAGVVLMAALLWVLTAPHSRMKAARAAELSARRATIVYPRD